MSWGNAHRRKTHCPSGHEYTPENTGIRTHKTKGKYRFCRTCDVARRQRFTYKLRYGIRVGDKTTMLKAQGDKCANRACPAKGLMDKHWHLDHDHATQEVRGVLCSGCNLALGHVKDDIARLRGLADYLEEHLKKFRVAVVGK